MSTNSESLESLLSSCKALLLDFDGPVCDFFAGHPADVVAAHLWNLMADTEVPSPPDAVRRSPHQLLQWAEVKRSDLTTRADRTLAEEELLAVETALPTEGAHIALKSASAAGIIVAIVSNNAETSIRRYLDKHDLAEYVSDVVGRPSPPRLMKPDPFPVLAAADRLGVRPQDCVFVGDAPTDIEAGRTAGTKTIGYAKRPARWHELRDAQADVVIRDMRELEKVLRR